MSNATYYLIASLLAALPVCAFVTGPAPGVWWWRSAVDRVHRPVAYWLIMAIPCAVLVLFLWTGRSWHLR